MWEFRNMRKEHVRESKICPPPTIPDATTHCELGILHFTSTLTDMQSLIVIKQNAISMEVF